MTEHFGFPIMIFSADSAVLMSAKRTQEQGGWGNPTNARPKVSVNQEITDLAI